MRSHSTRRFGDALAIYTLEAPVGVTHTPQSSLAGGLQLHYFTRPVLSWESAGHDGNCNPHYGSHGGFKIMIRNHPVTTFSLPAAGCAKSAGRESSFLNRI